MSFIHRPTAELDHRRGGLFDVVDSDIEVDPRLSLFGFRYGLEADDRKDIVTRTKPDPSW